MSSECKRCRGTGEVLNVIQTNEWAGHDVKYIVVTCPVCKGSGDVSGRSGNE